MKNKLNKKGSSLAIVAFTFIVISLLAITLFSFITKERNVHTTLSNGFSVNEVYAREKISKLYIQDILERAFIESKTQEEFVSNLKKQLSYYKDSNGEYIFPYLVGLEEQFDEKAKFSEKEAKLENIEMSVKVNFYNSGEKTLIVESNSLNNFTSMKS